MTATHLGEGKGISRLRSTALEMTATHLGEGGLCVPFGLSQGLRRKIRLPY